jgi:hypothetical protein
VGPCLALTANRARAAAYAIWKEFIRFRCALAPEVGTRKRLLTGDGRVVSETLTTTPKIVDVFCGKLNADDIREEKIERCQGAPHRRRHADISQGDLRLRPLWLGLAIVCAFTTFVHAAPFDNERAKNELLLKTNSFGIGRGMISYGQFLTPGRKFARFENGAPNQPLKNSLFARYLRRLNKNDVWIDMGAGSAVALREAPATGVKARRVAIGIQMPGEGAEGQSGLPQALKDPTQRLSYLAGDYIENRNLSELQHEIGQPAQVISDVLGPMSYTDRPDKVLDRYLELLAPKGKVFVSLSTMTRVESGVRDIGVEAWLRSIPGISVRRVYHPVTTYSQLNAENEFLSFVIEKQTPNARVPHALTIKSFHSEGTFGWTPERVFELPATR